MRVPQDDDGSIVSQPSARELPGTALFDVVHRRWSFEMMDALGLDRALLPECRESIDFVAGVLMERSRAVQGAVTNPRSRLRR